MKDRLCQIVIHTFVTFVPPYKFCIIVVSGSVVNATLPKENVGIKFASTRVTWRRVAYAVRNVFAILILHDGVPTGSLNIFW